MNKIAYNICYGGFTLSIQAVNWLEQHCNDSELKEFIKNEKSDIMSDIRIPKSIKNMHICSSVTHWFDERRHHNDLIAVIESLGDRASGDCAELRIFYTDSNRYRIEDYDGVESVITPDEQQDWVYIKR